MIALLLLLSACGGGADGASEADQLALDIRGEYLNMAGCTASVDMVADYGARVYAYSADVRYEKEGETVLTLTAPENVAGVSAHMEKGQTALEFDGVRVETGPLTDDGMSPVDAVPALIRTVQEGFMAECVLEEADGVRLLHIASRDPEKEPGSGVETQLWFDAATHALTRGEIAQDGYTVMQCVFSSFQVTG